MSKKSQRVLLLFDGVYHENQEDYAPDIAAPNAKTERDIIAALKELGHEITYFGIHDEIEPLVHTIKEGKHDLVFNLCEAIRNETRFEPNLVALLEMLGIKFTGSGSKGIYLSKDKGLTKEILAHHKVKVPKFVVSRRSRPLRSLKHFKFPAFIKPLQLESSQGISQYSFATNEKDALARVQFIHESLSADAIIEEYIEGRELYVSVLGNKRLTVFPPRELFFREVPEGEPKFATFRAKWDEAYRKKWGISSGDVAPLPDGLERRLIEVCKRIHEHLSIRGYSRIDLRVKDDGGIYFIEANPNPAIAKDEDFALSAAKAGIPYTELISKIVSLAD